MVTRDTLLPGIGLAGLWTLALVVLYIATMVAVKHIEPRLPWKAEPVPIRESTSEKVKAKHAKAASEKEKERSLGSLWSTRRSRRSPS